MTLIFSLFLLQVVTLFLVVEMLTCIQCYFLLSLFKNHNDKDDCSWGFSPKQNTPPPSPMQPFFATTFGVIQILDSRADQELGVGGSSSPPE